MGVQQSQRSEQQEAASLIRILQAFHLATKTASG